VRKRGKDQKKKLVKDRHERIVALTACMFEEPHQSEPCLTVRLLEEPKSTSVKDYN